MWGGLQAEPLKEGLEAEPSVGCRGLTDLLPPPEKTHLIYMNPRNTMAKVEWTCPPSGDAPAQRDIQVWKTGKRSENWVDLLFLQVYILHCVTSRVRRRAILLLKCPFVTAAFCFSIRQQALS